MGSHYIQHLNGSREPLSDAYLAECEQRARRFSGAYTGTSGDLAGRLLLCVFEVARLKCELAYRENRRMPAMEPMPD
jgi:hypothetical protein